MALIQYYAAGNGHITSGKQVRRRVSVVELFRMFPQQGHLMLMARRCTAEQAARLVELKWDRQQSAGPRANHTPADTRVHQECRKHFTVWDQRHRRPNKRHLPDWMFATYSVFAARNGNSATQL